MIDYMKYSDYKKEKKEMLTHIMDAVIAGVRGWVQTRPYACDVTCFHKQNESGEVIFTNFAFMPDGNVDVIWHTVTNVRETVDAIIDRISKIHDAYFRPLPKPNSPAKPKSTRSVPAIEKVIFNDPATIIFWKDGTKTVVKCSENDEFSPEVGMAMAISKKALGNKGNYCNEFKKWVEPFYEEAEETFAQGVSELFKKIGERLSNHTFDIGFNRPIEESKSPKNTEMGYCNSCKYQGVLYFKEPCESCLEAYYIDGSYPSWTPKD